MMSHPAEPAPPFALLADRAFDGSAMRGRTAVVVEAGRIAAIGAPQAVGAEALPQVSLPPDALIAPGLIDLQVNGGGGALLNAEPSPAVIARVVAAHRRFGTTGLLPTLITDAPERLEHLAASAGAGMAIPGVLGFHLEGPHLNPARKGIHPPEFMRPPSADDLDLLASFGLRGRSIVTLAPECVRMSDIAFLVGSGVRVSAGHSAADAAAIRRAIAAGLSGVTHLFNAMSQITSREPGLVGMALDDARLCAGIIADGICVDPVNLRLAFRLLGPDRLMLVSDAMPSVGDPGNGDFVLCGKPISLIEGRLIDAEGTLAGAHLAMDGAVRNAMRFMGASASEALTMASRGPARYLGLGDELGRLSPGFRADIAAFDASYQAIGSWIAGEGGVAAGD